MDPPKETEAELESFRQQWKAEVSARARQQHPAEPSNEHASNTKTLDRRKPSTVPSSKPTPRRININEGAEELEPRAYHDLPDKEEELKLGVIGQSTARDVSTKEPRSALEHYEKAVEKETQGCLGDSLKLYRAAFKLDDGVHETYKNKHFPPSSFARKPNSQNPNPSNAPVTVPNPAHHSLHGLPQSITELINDFSQLAIPVADPPTDLSPPLPCPIAALPEEILSQIFQYSALADLSSFARIAVVCKRFAYLVMTEEQIWKRLALGKEYGFAGMHYEYACDLNGKPIVQTAELDLELDDDDVDDVSDEEHEATPAVPPPDVTAYLLKKQYATSWRQMVRSRPRIRFNGCYISTVNYTRPGAASATQATWYTPVHIVTYFRYLRFFRDGTAISLLTTSEPIDVVHHLTKDNAHKDHHHSSALPSNVMKDALCGRWRLSGPGDGVIGDEAEGDVHVETEGVVPKYMWKMDFRLGSAGKGTRNNKLTWKTFKSYNRLTDDWGEFGLKNDRAYYWSRVKSYGMGW